MLNYEKAISDVIIEFFKQQETKIKDHSDFKDILLAYFHHVDKRIQPQKRQVVISTELQSKIDNNKIEDKYLIALNSFKSKFEDGQDMNGHLSKKIYDGDFYDKLLICWGIYHLHLTTVEAHNKNEMTNNRSGNLLFCLIKESFVYFIDIEAHGKKYVFSMFNLLEIIAENWIHLIENYEMKDIIPETLQPLIKEDGDINKLRKLNVNVEYELKNKYYSFIDKSLNLVGSSDYDTMRVFNIIHTIQRAMPKAPINPRNMKFDLSPVDGKLGILIWCEGTEKKHVYL